MKRWIWLGALLLLALSVKGSELARIALIALGLVGVLTIALGSSRPGGSRQRHARRLSYIARYRSADDLFWVSAVVGGSAMGEIVSALDLDVGGAAMLALFVGAGYGVATRSIRQAAAVVLGVLGFLALVRGSIIATAQCPSGLVAGSGRDQFVGVVLVTILVVVGVAWNLVPGLPKSRVGKLGTGNVVLLGFGLVEAVVFFVRPAGLDVWADTGTPVKILTVGVASVVVVLAGFGPRLVFSLVGVGVLFAELSLVLYEFSTERDAPALECGSSRQAFVATVLMAIAALTSHAFHDGKEN